MRVHGNRPHVSFGGRTTWKIIYRKFGISEFGIVHIFDAEISHLGVRYLGMLIHM